MAGASSLTQAARAMVYSQKTANYFDQNLSGVHEEAREEIENQAVDKGERILKSSNQSGSPSSDSQVSASSMERDEESN